ncbi:uncharacterized protein isoform X2 [Musca autumnalis]|uniref:uncharacterized protein isoform X2 n=1 Tax=Musca autumnalis TaxID=221902 RepID=UPI003CF28864
MIHRIFPCLFLLFHSALGQAVNYNSYISNINSLPPEQPELPGTGSNNNFQPNPYNTPYAPLSYSNEDFVQISPYLRNNGEEFQQLPTTKSIPFTPRATTPTGLWSGPPIVVEDIADYYSTTNDGQFGGNTITWRTPKHLHINNHRQEFKEEEEQRQDTQSYQQQPPQSQPSHFNYGNGGVIYHSDIRRHQIFSSSSPDTDVSTTRQQGQQPQRNVRIYNDEPEELQPPQATTAEYQHYHINPPQAIAALQSSYASNTNLNYFRNISGLNRAEVEEERLAEHATNYAKHFKVYLRKYPRRIKPEY